MSEAAERGQALLDWYRALDRAMPWRGRRDPYAVWVSEIMLQQTTVAAVRPRYEDFLARFPDVASLAAAEEEEVLGAVAGLGYYRRFRSLHAAARTVVSERAGALPETAAGWRTLPGIGDYTAAAIASIAFGERAAAVDGNVVRVLTRLDARGGRHDGVARRRELGNRLLELMPLDAVPGDFTQALFDLGREVCSPRSPRCGDCPWSEDCRARAEGDPERYPEAAPRARPEDRLVLQALVRRGDEVLLRRRPADASRMPDFWEFPEVWCDPGTDPALALRPALGADVEVRAERARARHAITRYRLDCRLVEIEVLAGVAGTGSELLWVAPDEVEARATPLSTITRKLLRRYLRDGDGAAS